jgi:hypothetical protein
MLYQFLLDDVVRKQPKRSQGHSAEQNEYVQSPTGELVPSKAGAGLLRAKSAPKRKDFHYPMADTKRVSADDDSLPNSPQLPEFVKTKLGKDEVKRRKNRLTM